MGGWRTCRRRPPPKVNFSSMGRVLGHCLTPAVIGIGAVRHLAWYVSYQMSGDARGA